MNIYSRFKNLIPKALRYYGTILSKTDYFLTVQILGGGQLGIFQATDLEEGSKVWITYENANWIIEKAPDLIDGGVIEV